MDDMPTERYDELYYFCKQYWQRENKINSLYGLKSVQCDGMPHGSTVGNPTEETAILLDKLKRENEIIRECAEKAAGKVLRDKLMENVTLGIPYNDEMYCGKRQFYEMRREFFKLLSKER